MKYDINLKKMTLKITASGKDEKLILKLLIGFGSKDMVLFPQPIEWKADSALTIWSKLSLTPGAVTISLQSKSITKEFIQKLLRLK